jgi:uncharacterized protein YjdB
MATRTLGSVPVRWGLLLLTACDLNMMGPQSCARSMTVSPPAVTVALGQTAQLTATERDTAGNDVTGYVTWSSDNAAVASVSQTGLVQGVAVGQTTVRAVDNGQSGAASVTVTKADSTRLTRSRSR